MAVLSHGYAMVRGADGRIVSETKDATVGEKVTISLADGVLGAEIVEIGKNDRKEN